MEPKFDVKKEKSPKLQGLSPEDHALLNDPMRTKEEGRRLFAAKREEYKNNPKALRQIDVYDGESPYYPKFKEYRDALISGDMARATELKTWLKINYPDIN